MKKLLVISTFLLLMVLIACSFSYGSPAKDYGNIIVFGVFIILLSSYIYFEKGTMGSKEIGIIATLSSFAAVARVPFAALPNVQPTTFLVALSGYVFGPYEGFLVGATSAFISNIFLGQGPWTPWQMLAWALIGAFSGFLGLVKGRKGKLISSEAFAALCFVYGFIFDWIMNLWHVLGFIKPLTMKAILASYATGLTLDIMHATGNFIFAIILFDSLYKVLSRFKKRLIVTYIKE
ncbi:MAG: ECF transporter S component [Clostridiales bacterium]|mgnify:CR=1 FL=1|nr:ECF transporter S component [Clostridiales bacterium]